MRGTYSTITSLAAASAIAAGLAFTAPARAAEDTIKVGILHSLSGTMAISETTLKDTMLFLIDEQNKKGGLLGKKLEAVVVDPASDWPLFAEKARELIEKDKVAAVFGCWTSVSRKSVLPVFEELDNLLFYPVQYEGEESQRNVFYTGAAPNQQAIPAVDYLMSEEGGSVKRWVLEGTDYVYPRTTNKILEAYLKAKGVAAEDIMINYTPFGFSDWQTEVAAIKKFGSAGKKTAVVSTINGDANVPFYKELGNQGIKAEDIPVVAFSVGEEELAGLDTAPLVGHLAAWNYFQSIDTPENADFIANWKAFIKNDKRVTNDPMEAHYHRLQHVGQGGREGRHHRSGQGDRRHRRRLGAEPHRRLFDHDAEPPHHQAGADRRDPGRRPVRDGLADVGPRGRRRMVGLPARLQGPDLRLARAAVVRKLQRRHRQMRRQGHQLTRPAASRLRLRRLPGDPSSSARKPTRSPRQDNFRFHDRSCEPSASCCRPVALALARAGPCRRGGAAHDRRQIRRPPRAFRRSRPWCASSARPAIPPSRRR